MKCAIYARYSSDMQRPESIDDQIRQCRQHIASKGWTVADGHIYTDYAVTGCDDKRAGYLAMKEGGRARLWDCVVVDDLSRLGRHTLESISTFDELTILGVNIVGVSDGIDTAAKNSKLSYYLRSMMNELFIDDLREKVKRGQAGQVGRGYSVGGRTYGYRHIEVPDPDGGKDKLGHPRRLGVRIEIDHEQAEVIRKIFELKVKGFGLKAIVRQLAAEGIPSPRYSLHGEGEKLWTPSSVRLILRQRRYIGDWTWNKAKWVKLPGSIKRRKVDLPPSEWVEYHDEDLRIVSNDLWNEVQKLHAEYKPKYGFQNGKLTGYHGEDNRGKFLFSGMLKCATCGANLVVISSFKYSSFVCGRHWSRGNEACKNDVRIPRRDVEKVLLSKIKRRILKPEIVMRLLKKLETRIEAHLKNSPTGLERKRERLHTLQQEADNLTKFIMGGDTSESVRKALSTKEEELKSARSELEQVEAATPKEHPRISQHWVRKRLQNLTDLLNSRADRIAMIRLELKNLLAEKILMRPVGTGRKGYYVAHVKGKPLNILKGSQLLMMVNSATGNRTPV